MIVGINGKILLKEPTTVDIQTNSGLVYRVHISLFTSSKIKAQKDEIYLHTTYIIKEDYQKLFGFFELSEKEIFDRVLKINGIGPSTALAICSTLNPDEFIKAVNTNNIEAFKKVPGIGPKSAKRILVELNDFTPTSDIIQNENEQFKEKAFMALESLGFKKESIKKALQQCNKTSTEELIKEALKYLK